MQLPDIINGFFEIVSGCLTWLNVWEVYKHKELKGCAWTPILLFSTWGYYNLFYYYHLEQFFSMWCCINLTLANSSWLGLILYYKGRNKNA